ncbi:MAG: M20/M25/M40 family metallo-hydrolase [Desulfobacteraceae bacterium]|nr:MAG: M20/M25/M40 family metallo-hydrolase [Desulfobacteraceae bacterium]
MTNPERYIEENRARFLDELFTLLRQPSISTRNEGVQECAELLAGMMKHVGIDTRIISTARHPVVYGEILREGAPTVLVYGHYDVQPPEPFDEWLSPPFEPTLRDGRIYCRGSSDNKAQLFSYVKAVEAFRKTSGELPVSIKFLYEGEEEIGSPNLAPFAKENRELLKADLAFFSDSHVHESGRPLLILGLKGMVYVDLKVQCAAGDTHSMRATSIPNPAWRLVWALSTLKDSGNRIRIPGFYDDVRELTGLEKQAVAEIPCDEAELLRYFGVKEFLPGRFSKEYYFNLVSEPTCNIAGFLSGFTGEGSKTVLPARAAAKMDIRLVPDQRPEDILRKLRQHLDAQGFTDIDMISHHNLEPSRTPIDHPAVSIIKDSLRLVYGQEPIVFPNIGGSGPNYVFTGILGVPCFVVPHAAHDQANHAPNESMLLEGYYRGIRTAVQVFQRLADER